MAKGKKILIVEDDESLLKPLVSKFTKEGFNVGKARNGEEGLEQIQKFKPEIVLLDIIMPKMDGLTMLRKMRQMKIGQDIPVIVLTNLSSDDNVAEAIENGAYDYLVKSGWKLEDVANKVKEKLGIK
jgi:two-component system, OmpR family, alkaline phosphatase synthesis response regulator PhoP